MALLACAAIPATPYTYAAVKMKKAGVTRVTQAEVSTNMATTTEPEVRVNSETEPTAVCRSSSITGLYSIAVDLKQ
jgi:hypothetical protein